MAKKIDVMEIGVPIARLFRLAFQNFQFILYSTVLVSLLALGYTVSPLIDEGTYVANGSIAHASNGSVVIKNTIIEAVTSTGLAKAVALQLEEADIGLIDGTFLSAETIQAGLTATSVDNSLRINITFSYPDETFSVTVLNEIIRQSITYANDSFPVLGRGVILGEYAISSTFDEPSYTLYLAIGALFGFTIGVVLSVLWDTLKGTLYSAQDLKELGLSALYLPLQIKVKFTPSTILRWLGFKNKKSYSFENEQTKLIVQGFVPTQSFSTIQNNLESTRPQPLEPVTTLVLTPVPNESLAMVAFAYARQSSTQGRKTLLIDFDLKEIPFTKYLERYQIETKKKPSTKEGVFFLSIEENLDLYLPLQDIIPAKVIRDEATLNIMTQVKKKYDHIVILAPSLLPDSSVLSMVQYANSALILGKTGFNTIIQMIQSFNMLIDANLTAIETLLIDEITKTQWPSMNEIKTWFPSKPKPVAVKAKPTRKK